MGSLDDAAEIRKLSSTSSFLGLADSILVSLDRETLSELLAAYLYFKSRGRTNRDVALFIATKKFGKVMNFALNVLAATIPALLSDKQFRTMIFDSVKSFASRKDRQRR